MIVYTKHRPMDCEAPSWASRSVKLSDIYLGDSRNKLADAIHNTSDDDLVAALSAYNRLLTMLRYQAVKNGDPSFEILNHRPWLPRDEEIEHTHIIKNMLENELCIRLRAGRVCKLVMGTTEGTD